ncbi:transcriptional regulator TbsP domain-containing protein [Halobaculum gomorrense]
MTIERQQVPTKRVSVLLCTPETAEATFADFLIATAAVDVRSAGRFAVRTAPNIDANVSVADGTVRAHVGLADGDEDASPSGAVDGSSTYGVVVGDDERLVEAVAGAYRSRWDDAETYPLEVPGRARIAESFADRWPAAAETLGDLWRAADELSRTGPFDPAAVCVLVGARHELLAMSVSE